MRTGLAVSARKRPEERSRFSTLERLLEEATLSKV